MMLDILTMQYLYGANTSYHRGDDVHTLTPNQPFMKTIWDAGGNDYDFGGLILLSLAPSVWSMGLIPIYA